MAVVDLGRLFDDLARGVFPEPDGRVDVVPPPEHVDGAVFSFTAHLVVATDAPADEVHAMAPEGDFSAWGRVSGWLAERSGLHAFSGDVLLVATATGGDPPVALEPVGDLDHPRVERAARYRDDVRVFATSDGRGVLVLGRGVAGRHELAFEVAPEARNAGLGRALVRSALALVPAGGAVWAQVHPGNVASLRPVLAAGFQPVGFEQLVGHD
jgi:GNAT superfamily N-acetyltransferase